MKKTLLYAAFLLWGVITVAQVKIGGNGIPNPNAMLDVESSNKGFLPPRVELEATDQADPLTSFTAAAGITVYNIATKGSGNTAVSPGYYYNDGTKWIRLVNDAENGLHTQTGTVKLGGELTENTTIATTTHDLAIKDLDEITVNSRDDLNGQKIVVSHETSGILKTIDAKVYAPANNTTVYKAKVTNSGSLLNVDIGGGWRPVNFGDSTDTFQNGAITPMDANGNLTIQESGIYAIGFYFRHGTGVQLSLLDLTGGGAGIRIVRNGNTASPLDLKLFSGANISLSELFNEDGSLSLPIIGNLGLLDVLNNVPIVNVVVAPIVNTLQSLTSVLQLSALVNALVGDNLLHLIISSSELNSVYALQAGDVLSFQTRLGGLSLGLLTSSEANLYLYKISEISE